MAISTKAYSSEVPAYLFLQNPKGKETEFEEHLSFILSGLNAVDVDTASGNHEQYSQQMLIATMIDRLDPHYSGEITLHRDSEYTRAYIVLRDVTAPPTWSFDQRWRSRFDCLADYLWHEYIGLANNERDVQIEQEIETCRQGLITDMEPFWALCAAIHALLSDVARDSHDKIWNFWLILVSFIFMLNVVGRWCHMAVTLSKCIKKNQYLIRAAYIRLTRL